MNNQTGLQSFFSFADILRSQKPREAMEKKLIDLLSIHLKKLEVVWNPNAFRGGLHNPELPEWLLRKLESLVLLAGTVQWKLSKNLKDELDATIEDIESFNPAFVEAMKKATKDVRAGRFISQEKLEEMLHTR